MLIFKVRDFFQARKYSLILLLFSSNFHNFHLKALIIQGFLGKISNDNFSSKYVVSWDEPSKFSYSRSISNLTFFFSLKSDIEGSKYINNFLRLIMLKRHKYHQRHVIINHNYVYACFQQINAIKFLHSSSKSYKITSMTLSFWHSRKWPFLT